MPWWTELKSVFAGAIGVDKNFLHVYFGVIGLLLTAALLRRRVASSLPIAILTILQLLNEVSDLQANWVDDQKFYWDHSAVDIFNTLALPLLIVGTARWTALFERPGPNPGFVSTGDAPPE